MDSGFNNLVEYISMQLSPENISDIINSALQGSVKQYIDNYVAREVKNLIMKALTSELETIKNQVSIFIVESKKVLDLSLEFIKKFGNIPNNHDTPSTQSTERDEILECFKMRRFNEGFEQFLQVQDQRYQDYYLSNFSIDELNEENLNQSLAVSLALWAINKKNKELLIKMISIIKKGDGLSTVLRKMVSANEPYLNDLRGLIIKKNL